MSSEIEGLVEHAISFMDFLDVSETGSEHGKCFENVAGFVLEKPSHNGNECLAVHGMVKHPEHGFYHHHAWVEWSGAVVDPSTGDDEALIMPMGSYYEIAEIRPDDAPQRYTDDELRDKLLEEGNYGPWE